MQWNEVTHLDLYSNKCRMALQCVMCCDLVYLGCCPHSSLIKYERTSRGEGWTEGRWEAEPNWGGGGKWMQGGRADHPERRRRIELLLALRNCTQREWSCYRHSRKSTPQAYLETCRVKTSPEAWKRHNNVWNVERTVTEMFFFSCLSIFESKCFYNTSSEISLSDFSSLNNVSWIHGSMKLSHVSLHRSSAWTAPSCSSSSSPVSDLVTFTGSIKMFWNGKTLKKESCLFTWLWCFNYLTIWAEMLLSSCISSTVCNCYIFTL